LRVAPGQERFVSGVQESLADDDPTCAWRYYLWRLLIDQRFQRRGYARAALDLVVAYVKGRPGAEALVTSAVPGDGSPIGFYLRYGFRLTGQVGNSEQVGNGEQVLELRLAGH
jgi:diamine N-acetyltransferase